MTSPSLGSGERYCVLCRRVEVVFLLQLSVCPVPLTSFLCGDCMDVFRQSLQLGCGAGEECAILDYPAEARNTTRSHAEEGEKKKKVALVKEGSLSEIKKYTFKN
ncbi:hypothetical protein Cni_G08346 [Canna indica]|uniref:Uncharacterized protein n=1 Tax=Canna indica TaxID=4628 RepID=A0AAQ3K055_9LILI|nr:hypothetical protein Cni_G08346 [Canna indica]